MIGQVTPTPTPTSSTPFSALFLVFTIAAVLLLVLFLATGLLAFRNKRQRDKLEARERDRRAASVGSEPQEAAAKQPSKPEDTLTMGDLVMSPELLETYVEHARREYPVEEEPSGEPDIVDLQEALRRAVQAQGEHEESPGEEPTTSP